MSELYWISLSLVVVMILGSVGYSKIMCELRQTNIMLKYLARNTAASDRGRPYQEAIADAMAWFRDTGYLDDGRIVGQKSE